jgi:hypothetical protein
VKKSVRRRFKKREYRYKKSTIVALKIAIIPFVLIYPIMIVFNPFNFTDIIIQFIIWIVVAGFLILILVDVIKCKVTINRKKISRYGLRAVREIPLDRIKGYKIQKGYRGNSQTLILYPDTKEFKVIRIGNNLKGYERILVWAQKNYPDVKDQ